MANTKTSALTAATSLALTNEFPIVNGGELKRGTLQMVVDAIPVAVQFACSDETTDLTAATDKITFRMPYAMTLTEVRASVGTAPTGAAITVDINQTGATVLSTKLTIDVNEFTSTTAATPAVISTSALTDDSKISVDVDVIGSTIAGAGLKVTLIGTRA